MKTAITAKENSVSSLFDPRFGRGAWFCIFDSETKTTEFIKNKSVKNQEGAGKKAAEKMLELGIQKVISGDFGTKARDNLMQFNIQMVILENEHQTIQEILQLLS